MGNRKRLTAFLLTAVMILTMPQMQIAAAEVESPADVGLCIHHTQHTEDCGYTEGEKETPCGHAHTEDCDDLSYTQATVRKCKTTDVCIMKSRPSENIDKNGE